MDLLDTTSTTNGRAIVLRKLIENFEASHPGVDIVVETQEWTTLATKFFTAHETGEAPDICMINTIMLGEALNRGVFEPMENLFLNEMSAEDKAQTWLPICSPRASTAPTTTPCSCSTVSSVFTTARTCLLKRASRLKISRLGKTWQKLLSS